MVNALMLLFHLRLLLVNVIQCVVNDDWYGAHRSDEIILIRLDCTALQKKNLKSKSFVFDINPLQAVQYK